VVRVGGELLDLAGRMMKSRQARPFSSRKAIAATLVSKTPYTHMLRPENEYPVQRISAIPLLSSPS
jgi:hypothetical protein